MTHKKSYRPYLMKGIYKYVSLVEEITEHNSYSYFYEINWNEGEVRKSLFKPNKISLLHHYIYNLIRIEKIRDYRKNPENYDEEAIEEIEWLFDAYGIEILPFEKFCKANSRDLEPAMYPWFEDQEDKFEILWEILTDEVHRLLFGNRSFLLTFNEGLAFYLEDNLYSLIPEHLNSNGKIKRTSIPKWIKDAVFFRDHGRCVFCGKDLTGLLATDVRLHYDHIVPLNKHGSNDPSNFQLACEECNVKKSGIQASTDIHYPAWWV